MDTQAWTGAAMTTQRLVLPLAPASPRAVLWLWLLLGLVPAAVAGGGFGYLVAHGRMVPASALAAVGGVVLPALLIGLAIRKRMQGHRLVLRATDVGVATGAHRQLIAYAELDLERARVLDLDEQLEFKPRLKTNGISLPGFQTGWYRLRNGNRALVARSGGKQALWVPTTRDFGLLLQPQVPPRKLLQALREAATESTGTGHAPTAPVAAEKVYWFPAKQFGWGWGVPSVWQGWVVLGLYLAGITGLMVFAPEADVTTGMIVLTVPLLIICWLKGEPPRWRWGDDEDF